VLLQKEYLNISFTYLTIAATDRSGEAEYTQMDFKSPPHW
jgi:hypothetical protein